MTLEGDQIWGQQAPLLPPGPQPPAEQQALLGTWREKRLLLPPNLVPLQILGGQSRLDFHFIHNVFVTQRSAHIPA